MCVRERERERERERKRKREIKRETNFCSSMGTSLAGLKVRGGAGKGSQPSSSSPTLASIFSQRSIS